ncbi:MAG: hypothetical protein WCI38_03870 [Chthoniobacterales bacterium]
MRKLIQYTVRGVSERTDSVLREIATEEGVSLNAYTLSLLDAAASHDHEGKRQHDLDALAGSWASDPAFDQAQEVFEQIDPALWR